MPKKHSTQELPKLIVEEGRPSLVEAIQSMNQFINQSQHMGWRVIKIIHGYGSSGVGGKLRIGLRQELSKQKRDKKIKDFIPGEHFGPNEEIVPYLRQYQRLREDPDFGATNPGITIIILK